MGDGSKLLFLCLGATVACDVVNIRAVDPNAVACPAGPSISSRPSLTNVLQNEAEIEAAFLTGGVQDVACEVEHFTSHLHEVFLAKEPCGERLTKSVFVYPSTYSEESQATLQFIDTTLASVYVNVLDTETQACDSVSLALQHADTCQGDVNHDGIVDPLDLGFASARLGCSFALGAVACGDADANHDGIVDPLDLGYIASRFGTCTKAY